MLQPLWKAAAWLLAKLNPLSPYDSAIKPLGTYPEELKTYVHTKTCTQMFIAAFIIVVKTWKQLRCPSESERIHKQWSIQTEKYYSALQRKELSNHEKTWRNSKCILLRERHQYEKAMYCVIPIIWHSGKGKTTEAVKRSVVARDLGREGFRG